MARHRRPDAGPAPHAQGGGRAPRLPAGVRPARGAARGRRRGRVGHRVGHGPCGRGLRARSRGRGSATHDDAYRQDVVLVLRAPEDAELRLLRPGATLVSMLHFPTRPERVRCLRRLGVDAVSLDSLADDAGRRLVEDARAVAWNGLDVAFGVLEERRPRLLEPAIAPPIRVTILGAGAVGREAVEAATKYGDPARFERTEAAGLPGVEVVTIGRNLSRDAVYLRKRLRDTDILVDAAARHDTQTAGDPERLDRPAAAARGHLRPRRRLLRAGRRRRPSSEASRASPPATSTGRSSSPTIRDGSDASRGVPSRHRRTVVSCYSWPGIRPRECMELYGEQLAPLMIELLDRGGLDGLRPAALGARPRAAPREPADPAPAHRHEPRHPARSTGSRAGGDGACAVRGCAGRAAGGQLVPLRPVAGGEPAHDHQEQDRRGRFPRRATTSTAGPSPSRRRRRAPSTGRTPGAASRWRRRHQAGPTRRRSHDDASTGHHRVHREHAERGRERTERGVQRHQDVQRPERHERVEEQAADVRAQQQQRGRDRNWWTVTAVAFATRLPNTDVVPISPHATDRKSRT